MNRSRRFYYLDGKRIDSSEVDGFLYTRRRNIETSCMGCEKSIVKGEQYVIFNYYDVPDPIHLDCFCKPCILGVKQTTEKRFGVDRGIVYCKKFTQDKHKKRKTGLYFT